MKSLVWNSIMADSRCSSSVTDVLPAPSFSAASLFTVSLPVVASANLKSSAWFQASLKKTLQLFWPQSHSEAYGPDCFIWYPEWGYDHLCRLGVARGFRKERRIPAVLCFTLFCHPSSSKSINSYTTVVDIMLAHLIGEATETLCLSLSLLISDFVLILLPWSITYGILSLLFLCVDSFLCGLNGFISLLCLRSQAAIKILQTT